MFGVLEQSQTCLGTIHKRCLHSGNKGFAQ